jgi:hypothetical protein
MESHWNLELSPIIESGIFKLEAPPIKHKYERTKTAQPQPPAHPRAETSSYHEETTPANARLQKELEPNNKVQGQPIILQGYLQVCIAGYHGPHEMGQTSSQRKAGADGGRRSVG